MTEPPTDGVTEDRAVRTARLAELMNKIGAGDTTAFEELYDAVAPLVYGTAVKVLRDPGYAAEVTQEVLLEVWKTSARFDPVGGSVTSWVATIAHRRAVDRVRSVQSQRDRDQRATSEDYNFPQESAAEEAERNLERQRVLDCLGTLSELQRAAVYSAYYDGFTHREVAERAGAALGTVKSRIRDGLKRLKQCLEVQR